MKPGTTEYVTAHQAVRRERGLPDACVACGEPACDWACVGDYSDVGDYQAMCKSCHISLDRRRAHDRREDHAWETRDGTRCAPCRARSKAAEYRRIKSDPIRNDKLLAQNREAVRRYRTGGD